MRRYCVNSGTVIVFVGSCPVLQHPSQSVYTAAAFWSMLPFAMYCGGAEAHPVMGSYLSIHLTGHSKYSGRSGSLLRGFNWLSFFLVISEASNVLLNMHSQGFRDQNCHESTECSCSRHMYPVWPRTWMICHAQNCAHFVRVLCRQTSHSN